MTDRLAEIKANHDRDIRTYDAMGIDLPRQCKDIAWLIAEVERLRPDAERWRYVRKNGPSCLVVTGVHRAVGNQYWEHVRVLLGEEADAAVDASRKVT